MIAFDCVLFRLSDQEEEFMYPQIGWNQAPSGRLLRGDYEADFKMIDGDGTVHVECKYGFTIITK